MLLVRASQRHLSYLRDEANRSASTIKVYGGVERLAIIFLSEFLGRPPTVSDLNAENVRAFIRWLATEHTSVRHGGTRVGHSPQNVAYHLRIVKLWASFLVDDEMIPYHPLAKVKPPKVPKTVPRILTRQQVDLLLTVAAANPSPWSRWRNVAMLEFVIDTGVRVSELWSLRQDEVELATRIRPQGRALIHGKGSKERYVQLGVDASRAIRRYWDEVRQEDAGPWAFLADDGEQMTQSSLDAIFKRLAEKATIPRTLAHWHALRHFNALERLRAGQSLADVQHQLGHASIRDTARYLTILKDDPDQPQVSVMDTFRSRRRPPESPRGAG